MSKSVFVPAIPAQPHKQATAKTVVVLALVILALFAVFPAFAAGGLESEGKDSIGKLTTLLKGFGGGILTIALMYVGAQMWFLKKQLTELGGPIIGGLIFGLAPLIAGFVIPGG